MENRKLKKRILDISYEHKLSHLGSCLTALPIIKEIYDIKKDDEKFVLSAGHAGLALYVVLESKGFGDAKAMLLDMGIHPTRTSAGYVDCSTGSLGHGLPIALGMALADRSKNVYCMVSDGELAEGSCYEALNVKNFKGVDNLKVYVNANGYSAYAKIEIPVLTYRDVVLRDTSHEFDGLPFLQGLDGHYHVLNEQEYREALSYYDKHK